MRRGLDRDRRAILRGATMSEAWLEHPVMRCWLSECENAGYCTPDDLEMLRTELGLPKYQMHDLWTDALLPELEKRGIRYRARRLKSGSYATPAVRSLPHASGIFPLPPVVRQSASVRRGDRPVATLRSPDTADSALRARLEELRGGRAETSMPAAPLGPAVIVLCTAGPPGLPGNKLVLSGEPGWLILRAAGSHGSQRIPAEAIVGTQVARGGKPIAGGVTGAALGGLLFGPLGMLAGGMFGAAKGGFTFNMTVVTDDQVQVLFTFGGLYAPALRELADLMAFVESAPSGREGAKGETRACPWCAEQIKAAAKICRFCGRDV